MYSIGAFCLVIPPKTNPLGIIHISFINNHLLVIISSKNLLINRMQHIQSEEGNSIDYELDYGDYYLEEEPSNVDKKYSTGELRANEWSRVIAYTSTRKGEPQAYQIGKELIYSRAIGAI